MLLQMVLFHSFFFFFLKENLYQGSVNFLKKARQEIRVAVGHMACFSGLALPWTVREQRLGSAGTFFATTGGIGSLLHSWAALAEEAPSVTLKVTRPHARVWDPGNVLMMAINSLPMPQMFLKTRLSRANKQSACLVCSDHGNLEQGEGRLRAGTGSTSAGHRETP